MTRLKASALPILVALASCTPQTFRVDVGAMLAQAGGKIALQDAGGTLNLGGEKNDIDADLGVGEIEASPYVRLEWEHENHRVRVHGFGFDSEGTGVLSNDFGGLVPGSNVTTSLRFFSAAASYGYECWGNEQFRLALGGQLGVYSMDVAARSGVGREEIGMDVVVPMPFVEFETYLGGFTFGINGGIMAADLGDGDGTYADVEGYTRFQLTNEIDLFGGYRFIMMDGDATADGRDFEADVDVQGFYFGGGIRF